MNHDDVPPTSPGRPDPAADLGHPRGTLAIVLLFGALFAVGWFVMYLTRYVPGGVPHH